MSEKTIGTLSRFTGIPAHTIKYYEKIGILSSKRKEHSNYRSYDITICTDLYECIKYRSMGFSLKETKELIKETDEQLLNKRLNERKCQIEEKIRELQQQKEGLERYQEEIAAAEQRIGKWYIEECSDFYFRPQTRELSFDGGEELESDGINLAEHFPASKNTVWMNSKYLRGEKKGYSWGFAISPGAEQEWIRGKQGYRYLPAGRAFVLYLRMTGPYVSDGSMAEEIRRFYQEYRNDTPPEAFGVRLKITHDEQGRDWNYFKIVIPLER